MLVLQSDEFRELDSIIVVPFTTTPSSNDGPFFRLRFDPSQWSGLDRTSWLMIDKMQAVRRGRLKRQLGEISDAQVSEVLDLVAPFLSCYVYRPSLARRVLRLLHLAA